MISKESVELIKRFRDERNWAQFHNPKDLAISINLEAAELLEIFQWSAGDLECKDKLDKIREEAKDVNGVKVFRGAFADVDINTAIIVPSVTIFAL